MSGFKLLNLSDKILSALEQKGYTDPTPIQLQAIPHLLKHKDLLGVAQTGTGKTAAFALPILDNLTKSNKKVRTNSVRSLILSPTRELASQIADNIDRYGKNLGLSHLVVFGGVNINTQINAMRRGVDIVIATPGRLLDLMDRGYIDLSQVEIFVLDEADRMLDMGFIRDINKITKKLPKERQNLLFSATMPQNIIVLANKILQNPLKVEVTPQATTVSKIDQRVNLVEKSNKLHLLEDILKQEKTTSVLVFSKTKHGANKIVKYLTGKSISVEAIHGNKSQSARERALDGFRKGKIKVLIATDIAARGIDVPNITHVINFDIPNDPESYVHRIGRTARAGKDGIAISFCDPSESKLLRAIERIIKYKIPIDESHSFHGVEGRVEQKVFSNKSDKTSRSPNKKSFTSRQKSNRHRAKKK
jgi:ATP-dependent RNA helicase RhlE